MNRLLRSLTLAILLLGGAWAGATAADLFDPPAAVVHPSATPTRSVPEPRSTQSFDS